MSAPARSRRDRVVDATCVTLAALTAVAFMQEALDVRSATGPYLAASVLLSAFACAALWWRRRWPVGVALAVLPVGAFTEFAAMASLVSVFTVAVHRPWRTTAALVAAHCVASVPYSILRPDPDLQAAGADAGGLALMGILFSLVLLMPLVWWGMSVRARRAKLAALRERAERAETEADALAERVRSREREHIAREMHDVLAHRISLVSLHAGALEIRRGMPPEEVAEVARTIRASAHQALEDLREILGVLRPGDQGSGVRPLAGLNHLEELLADCRAAGTRLHLDNRLPDIRSLPFAASRTAYRVVQEGLTNARKHAPDGEVALLLERTGEGELHVWLRNPLPGAPPPAAIPGSRSGLIGLSERVELAGGRLDYGVRRARDGTIGFHLETWLPWPG